MATQNGTLDGLVRGDDYDVIRTVTGVPVGTSLTDAWLTVKLKTDDADPGLFQKKISTTLTAQGQIDDDGAGDQTATMTFQLSSADTTLFSPNTVYHYDIQVKTATGKIYTPELGTVTPCADITIATT